MHSAPSPIGNADRRYVRVSGRDYLGLPVANGNDACCGEISDYAAPRGRC